MIYTLYFLYRYYSTIYYIITLYHGYRISYDIYNGGKYLYTNIPLLKFKNNQIEMNGFQIKEIKNNWQYVDIY